ncbi:MAG: phage minor head protein [Chitinophagales bacterium]|nr:phage minor head protein [Chitinophagales bacterium]
MAQLKRFYRGCGCRPQAIQLSDDDKLNNLHLDENTIKRIFNGEIKDGEIPYNLYLRTAQKLTEALLKGIRGKVGAVSSGKTKLFDRLRNNIFAFSAAKSLTQLQEYKNQLTDENGEPKSYARFRQDVTKIGKEFNDVYLKIEYDSAMSMAQMSDKWQTLKQYDYLEYRTVGDSNVRKAHQMLDGIVLRSDDPLWSKIYPPNDWNCRCTVIPAPGSSTNDQDRQKAQLFAQSPALKPYFKRNVGTEQVVFNDDHPYFSRTPIDLAKNKQRQFMAEENYGMPSVETILNRKLPELNLAATEQEAYEQWLNSDKHIFTADGLEWNFNDRWEHVVSHNNEDRWKLINNTKDVLENADEVWSYREKQPDGKFKIYKRYVKYYQNQPVVFSYDIDEPEKWTMYATNVDSSGTYTNMRNYVRRGQLLFRK